MKWLKKKLKKKKADHVVSMSLPKSWEELSDQQLYDVFGLMSHSLSANQIKTICIFRWAKLKVLYELDNGFFACRLNKRNVDLQDNQIAYAVTVLDFLDEIPKNPVRIAKIQKRFNARPARITGTTLREYLYVDNLYQGYLHTQKMDLLTQMIEILYDTQKLVPNIAEKISTFYWWTSLKALLTHEFPHFFAPMDNLSSENMLAQPDLHKQLTDAMNAQIRALTQGDVTKEEQVLNTECWRAFAELDAIADEQQKMKAKYGKH